MNTHLSLEEVRDRGLIIDLLQKLGGINKNPFPYQTVEVVLSFESLPELSVLKAEIEKLFRQLGFTVTRPILNVNAYSVSMMDLCPGGKTLELVLSLKNTDLHLTSKILNV